MLFSRKKKKGAKVKVKKAKKKAAKKKVVKKKIVRKKAAKKKVARRTPAPSKGEEVQIGFVTHYFPHVKAGAIMIESGKVEKGDVLHIKGHTTDLKQKIKSLQIERVSVQEASAGDEIGLLVRSRVRINDKVYKITR